LLKKQDQAPAEQPVKQPTAPAVVEPVATDEEIAALQEAKAELKKKKTVTKSPATKTLAAKKPVKKAK
jgi:hypothetical protein